MAYIFERKGKNGKYTGTQTKKRKEDNEKR